MNKIKILLALSFVTLGILLSVRFQAKQVKIECPHEVQAATSNIVLPFDKIPALKATLEITGNGTNISPRDIGVQLVRKQASRANSPLLIQLSQVQLNDVPAGNYHLKVILKKADNDLVLATLDLDSNIGPGTSIDFGKASWNYACDQCDSDGDHYNNLTEIMNGVFHAPSSGTISNEWLSSPTNANRGGEQSYPERPSLLRPAAISVMSPGPNGRLKIVGDPFSVQSAVYVTADLLNPNGLRKGKGEGYSRIDGSFDLSIDSGATAEDKILLYTITQKGLGEAQFDSSRADVGPNSKLELIVKNFQGCQ